MPQRRPDRVRGPGHDDFRAWCNRRELRLQACEICGRGNVVSWCTFEYDYYRDALPLPYETILVELEEGPLFISNPLDLTWRDLTFNLAVKLAFLACEDAAGSFQLPVFEKA